MSRPATFPTRRNISGGEEVLEDPRFYRLFDRVVSLTCTPKCTSKSFLKSIQSIQLTSSELQHSNSCSICMEDFVVGSVADQLPCKHLFHKDCIVQWLNRSNTCPLCRFKLPLESPVTAASPVPTLSRRSNNSDSGGGVIGRVVVTTFRTVGGVRVNGRTFNFDISSGSNRVGDVVVDADGDTLMTEDVRRDADGDIVMIDA